MRPALWLLVLALHAAFVSFAQAHRPSDSYLSLWIEDNAVRGRWDIALRDLHHAFGLDGDEDGTITWGEVKARHGEIAAYALGRLSIASAGRECPMLAGGQRVERHSDGAYTVLAIAADCRRPIAALEVRYSLFFDLDPTHRGLLALRTPAGARSAVFGPGDRIQRFEIATPDPWRSLVEFGREGAWHIWIGFDHILFLLTLLLPAVLRRNGEGWQAVDGFRAAFSSVARVVTAFTIAHSITLGLAAAGVVALPSRLVESIIAVSVIVAALNNLLPVVTRRLWSVAFAFGLVHGFGFAGVLSELGLGAENLVPALAGFNLGVELGQIAIVAAFLPPAFALRTSAQYPRLALRAGSVGIAAVAAAWFVERAFGLGALVL